MLDLIRETFAGRLPDPDAVTGDQKLNPDYVPDREPVAAAVLVPVILRRPQPTVMLTTRNAQLRAHAGQIAFPGGRTDPGDADAVATALRELEEEVGVSADQVSVIGCANCYRSGSGYLVTPVLATLSPQINLVPQAEEVEDIFEVPLSVLFDPANRNRTGRHWRGAMRYYYEIPVEDTDGRSRYVWGLTAGIIAEISALMGLSDCAAEHEG